jgi:hypothetical protein
MTATTSTAKCFTRTVRMLRKRTALAARPVAAGHDVGGGTPLETHPHTQQLRCGGREGHGQRGSWDQRFNSLRFELQLLDAVKLVLFVVFLVLVVEVVWE